MVWEHEVIGQHLARERQWEPVNLELARRLLALGEAKNVLDVGANLGAFAVPIARMGLGSVHAFEPQRIVFQQLCGNAFLNGLDNLVGYEMALGNPPASPQWIDFPDPDYAREFNPGGLSILSFSEHDRSRATYFKDGSKKTRKVRYASLDSLDLPPIGLVKIDVEGAEELVVRGAVNTLVKNRFPPILFEAWTAEWFGEQKKALLQCLEDFGYEVSIAGEYGVAQHESRTERCSFRYDEATKSMVFP